MRVTLGRVLLLVAFVFGLYSAVLLQPWFEALVINSAFQNSTDQRTTSSLCFDIAKDEWLSFALPLYARQLKLVFNPVVNNGVGVSTREPLRYAIEYEFLGNAQTSLKTGQIHFESVISKFRSATGLVHLGQFFYETSLIPGDSVSAVLTLGDDFANQVKALRVRSVVEDPRMHALVGRVYVKQSVSVAQAQKEWQRMSSAEKDNLVRANVFSRQLLSPEERLNVLAQRWDAVAPTGVSGVSYRQRTLFKISEDSPRIPEEPMYPEGVYVESGYHATVRLPQELQRIVVRLTSLDGQTDLQPARVRGWLHSLRGDAPRQLKPRRVGEVVVFEESRASGILEVQSEDPAVLRAAVIQEQEEVDFTPEPELLRVYQLNVGEQLEFATIPRQQQGAFKVVIRARCSDSCASQQRWQAHIVTQAALGQELSNWTISGQPFALSAYDREDLQQEKLSEGTASLVSVPQVFYFRTDPQAAKVLIRADSKELLVALYNRPDDLVPTTSVPEEDTDSMTGSLWHLLVAPDHYERLKSLKAPVLALRAEPPLRPAHFDRGDYTFEQFLPLGRWVGRYGFIEYHPEHASRPELLSVFFREVVDGQVVELQGRPWETEVSPKLLMIGAQSQAEFKFSVGRAVKQESKIKVPSVVQLPTVPLGEHKLALAPEKLRFFLNQQRSVSDKGWLQVFVQQLDDSLVYPVQKRAEQDELVLIQFFSLAKSSQASKIEVELLMPKQTIRLGPSSGFTFRKRRYSVRPGTEAGLVVPELRDVYQKGGQRLLFPLGTDLPAGEYQMKVTLLEGPQGFVRVSRITAGVDPVLTMHTGDF